MSMFDSSDIPASQIPTTLTGQFARQAPRYGLGLFLLASYQYLQYWFDTHLSKAIDSAGHGDSSVTGRIGAELIFVALVSLFIRVFSRMAIFNGGRIAEYELRKALLYQLQRLGPTFYRRMPTGDIMSRATNDLAQVRLLLGFGALNLMNTAFALVSSLAVTLQISGKLTAASLSTLPVLFLVMWGFARLMFQSQRQNQDAIGQLSAAVQSSIAGVRVVRSFALEDEEIRRFEVSNLDYLAKSLGLARLRGLMFPVMQAITAVGTIIVLWYGGDLMLHGQMSAGNFLAFFRALNRLTWPLISLGFLTSLLQRGRASFARLEEVFQATPDIDDGPLPAIANFEGRLSVRGLSFSYGDQPVLEDVSFDVAPGTLVAIVGKTGRSCRGSRTRRAARCSSTEKTSAICRSTSCEVLSATRSKWRFCSRRRWDETSGTVSTNPTRTTRFRSSAAPREKRRSTRKSRCSPTVTTRSSASAACSSLADRSSASPWRGRSSQNRASSSSTTR
jgi:ATP-binding cassette subfamily B protein